MKTLLLVLSFTASSALSQTTQPTPPEFSVQESLELQNVTLQQQLVAALQAQENELNQKILIQDAQRAKSWAAFKSEIEHAHPGYTVDNFGNFIPAPAKPTPGNVLPKQSPMAPVHHH
jgi:hypothetical protein